MRSAKTCATPLSDTLFLAFKPVAKLAALRANPMIF
jgi:hypothetical protein